MSFRSTSQFRYVLTFPSQLAPSPGTTIETVNGINFMCTEPINAQMPSGATDIKHLVVQDASECQFECMDAGPNKCNVFAFEPSEYAQNCTIGRAMNYTRPLKATTNPESVAGYCLSEADVQNSMYFPPYHE